MKRFTLKVNEKKILWKEGMTLFSLRRQFKPQADIMVYNGFPVTEDCELRSGDQICLINRGEIPTAEELKYSMVARHSPEVFDQIHTKTVGIAGVGGLGASLAIALARLSIGKIVCADFDVIEPSNLNRQQYFIDQIGLFKVEALKENLARINPYLIVEVFKEKIDRSNIARVFRDCDVIAECFDNPNSKSELVQVVLRDLSIPIVAVSGIAGYKNADKLVCRRRGARFFLIGDGVSAAEPGMGLMAPKVGIAAHLQANKILELLLQTGEEMR